MITKTYVKRRKVTKITFARPTDADADARVPNDHGGENGVIAG